MALAQTAPKHRVVGGGRLPAAGEHQVGALAVVVLAGVDAAHQAEVVHLPGDVRQQLGDLDAGHRGADRAERAAGLGAGLGVPAFELAQAAVHVEDDDPLLILLELRGRERPREDAQAADHRPGRPSRPCPARNLRRAIVCSGEWQEYVHFIESAPPSGRMTRDQ